MRLLITDTHFLPQNIADRLHELPLEADVYTGDEIPPYAERYTMAFGGKKFKSWGLEAFTKLEFLQLSMAGYNHLPIDAWKARLVVLSNAKDVFSEPIAEWVLFYILMFYKNGLTHLRLQAQARWERQLNRELVNQRAIVYGTGSIALAIVKRLKVFGVESIGVNRDGRPIEGFEQCVRFNESKPQLKTADIVIMTLPLNAQTEGAFDASFVDQMKLGAIFLNVGRGLVVDQDRLTQRLIDQTLAFAALDVFDEEPLESGHPLWRLPNVCVTPHDSGTSLITAERLWDLLKENTRRHLEKKAILHRL